MAGYSIIEQYCSNYEGIHGMQRNTSTPRVLTENGVEGARMVICKIRTHASPHLPALELFGERLRHGIMRH